MKIISIIGILFYTAVICLIGMTLILFSLNLLPSGDILSLISYLQDSPNSKIIVGLSGLLLIIIGFSFAQLFFGRFQRERTIAFTTSSGEVTIALSAVEDLIRRLAGIISEIKELRPDVIATKKGIIVDIRVVLKSEANIPDLTSRLQDLVKAKIQEVLGVEEQIIVKIHVVKIIPHEEKERKRKEIEKEESKLPFGGYGRA